MSPYDQDRKHKTPMMFSLILIILISTSVIFNIAKTETTYDEKEIQKLVSEGDFPSLHIGIVTDNEINWVSYGDQTSNDTVFLIGSIQKTFVAISVLQLYEEGRIGLDDNVNDYLSFNLENPDFPNSPITIRMLLSHRSGLRATLPSEFSFDWDGLHYPDYSKNYYASVIGISLGEYLSRCLPINGSLYEDSNWLFEPGTQYSYSNTGYKVLMHVLEKVSNQTISEYMHENIFDPLRMNNTGFNASELSESHAFPYTRTFGNSSNKLLPVWNGRYMLRSTVCDMGNLMIALMNDGKFDGYQLLQQDTVTLMFSNTVTGLRSQLRILLPTKEILRAGYGFGIEVCNNGLFGHGGSTVGFTAECFFNPSNKIGFIRFSNVNAILDYTSTEWKDINRVTDEIQSLIMTSEGLLPQYDVVIFALVGLSGVGMIMGVRAFLRSRRK